MAYNMQIAVKVETGFNCNWRNIEPLQPEGFKGQTANEKETQNTAST